MPPKRAKKRKASPKSFDAWLAHSLARDPDLAARVERRLAEMQIEQDLIALREQRGLTQAQLARLLGVSQPAVAKMEARGGNLETRTLARAAEVLGAHLEVRLIANRKPRTRIKKKPATKTVDRDREGFVRLADRLVHTSDASKQARLKKKLARRVFGD